MAPKDIETVLTTFETAEAHGVDIDKRAAILAPQLIEKARLAYAAMARRTVLIFVK